MPVFDYQALDADEELVAGRLEADGVQQAIAALEARGLRVQSIGLAALGADAGAASRAAASLSSESSASSAASAPASESSGEPSALGQRMAAVLAQSRAIVPALSAYAEEMPPGRRHELRRVCRVLEHGDLAAATAALASRPEFWIPLLNSAAAADPARVLRRFVDQSRQADDLRQQWRRALAYPAVVALIALGLIVGMSLFIMPAFRRIFDDFGLSLPGLTKMVLGVSDSIQNGEALWLAVVALAFVGAGWAIQRFLPAMETSRFGERLFGWFGRSSAIAQLCGYTADLLDAGLEVPEALRIAALASHKRPIRRAGVELAQALQTASGSPAGRGPSALTAAATYALASPMATPARAALLKELGASYFDRAQNRLSWTHGIVGPVAICVVGFVVGVAVLALFLPLVSLINNLSG